MTKVDAAKDATEDFNDSPFAWFAELLLALDRRDVDRAAEAKNQLSRIGWTFRYRKPNPTPTQGGDA